MMYIQYEEHKRNFYTQDTKNWLLTKTTAYSL